MLFAKSSLPVGSNAFNPAPLQGMLVRPVHAVMRRAGPGVPKPGVHSTEHDHETYLPTVEDAPQAHPWLPRAHAHRGRSRRDQRASRQRPQAPGCLRSRRIRGQRILRTRSMNVARESAGARPAVRLIALSRPSGFMASLRASGVQACEFRLHRREVSVDDRLLERVSQHPPARSCVVGFVVPKRYCRHAVRRNLIRRVMREALRRYMLEAIEWPADPPVLVFRLMRALPTTFVSASSPALRLYVGACARDLLRRDAARSARGVGA